MLPIQAWRLHIMSLPMLRRQPHAGTVEDISEQESLYKKLWSFGVRSLRSRECGLYEAADILLGVYEKSDVIQWVSVKRPEKKKVRIKGYRELQQMAELDPDSNDLYQANLLDNFYPNRLAALSHVCQMVS